jgi:exosome complex RNA-binding protein Csl4
MNKQITEYQELPQGWGRLYVGDLPIDTGPIRVGDIIKAKIDPDVDLYIKVETIGSQLGGVVVAIGPRPRIKYGPWKVEDHVTVAEPAVHAVIRR